MSATSTMLDPRKRLNKTRFPILKSRPCFVAIVQVGTGVRHLGSHTRGRAGRNRTLTRKGAALTAGTQCQGRDRAARLLSQTRVSSSAERKLRTGPRPKGARASFPAPCPRAAGRAPGRTHRAGRGCSCPSVSLWTCTRPGTLTASFTSGVKAESWKFRH